MKNTTVETLALFGGKKTIDYDFPNYNSLGAEEELAVAKVMKTGVLSKFLGCWHEDFYGGPKVQELERFCEEYFNVKHAISVNSWTSGLIAAIGALDIEPGDEIIVSPWTMSASATAIIHWNAIPVFADIEADTFNIDPLSVEEKITDKTKAILAVDIFGHSADMDALMNLAKKYGLKIISDTAQAPGAYYKGKHAGTIADIGGYSFNYHKHIHCGEGGLLVTDDDDLAERMRLIRNHAEAVVEDKGLEKINNMIGYNFRLGEIESAIAIEQLKKLNGFVKSRQQLANHLTAGLEALPGLKTPIVLDDCTHVYYVYPLVLDVEILGCSRDLIAKALIAEGLSVATKYQNLHLLPMYQQKIAYGSDGFPWKMNGEVSTVNYNKGICPIAEDLNDKSYIAIGMCVYDLTIADIDLIVNAFKKVWSNLDELNK